MLTFYISLRYKMTVVWHQMFAQKQKDCMQKIKCTTTTDILYLSETQKIEYIFLRKI